MGHLHGTNPSRQAPGTEGGKHLAGVGFPLEVDEESGPPHIANLLTAAKPLFPLHVCLFVFNVNLPEFKNYSDQ